MSLTRKVKINPSPLFRPTVNNKARKLTIVLTVSTNDADITPGVLGETLQKALETAGFGVGTTWSKRIRRPVRSCSRRFHRLRRRKRLMSQLDFWLSAVAIAILLTAFSRAVEKIIEFAFRFWEKK